MVTKAEIDQRVKERMDLVEAMLLKNEHLSKPEEFAEAIEAARKYWTAMEEGDTFNTKFNVHLIPTGFEYWDDEEHFHIGMVVMPDGLVWHALSNVVEHGEIPARDGDDDNG